MVVVGWWVVVGWCVVGGDHFAYFAWSYRSESKVEKISRWQLSRVQLLLRLTHVPNWWSTSSGSSSSGRSSSIGSNTSGSGRIETSVSKRRIVGKTVDRSQMESRASGQNYCTDDFFLYMFIYIIHSFLHRDWFVHVLVVTAGGWHFSHGGEFCFWRLISMCAAVPQAKAETKSRRRWTHTRWSVDWSVGGWWLVVVVMVGGRVVVIVVVIEGESPAVERRTIFFSISVQDGFFCGATTAGGGGGGQQRKKQRFGSFFFFFPKVAVSGTGGTPAAATAHGNCCFRLLRRWVLCARRNTTTHNIDGRCDVTWRDVTWRDRRTDDFLFIRWLGGDWWWTWLGS